MSNSSVFQIKAQGILMKGYGQEESGTSSQRLLWKAPFAILYLAIDLGAKWESIPGLKTWFCKDYHREGNGRCGANFLSLFNVVSIKSQNQSSLVGEKKTNRKSFSFWSYPFTPFLGGLLLNWRVCRCLNLGGPLRGVVGPWLEAGGTKVVVSLILIVQEWPMVLFWAPLTVREKERILQSMRTADD